MALVIEWDDLEALGDLDESVALISVPLRTPDPSRMIATVVGALGVLALAAWGLHRLTAG